METKNITVVACSGASNTGQYSDLVARRMEELGYAGMACLAKVAIGDKKLIEKLKSENTKVIVLDGCPINCAEKILGKEGVTNIVNLNTTDFGIKKGVTPITAEKTDEIINYIKTL